MTTIVVHRSSKRIAPFRLHRPDTVEEAVALWRQSERTASFMAGGMSLLDAMKSGLQTPAVIHLGRVSNFRGVLVDQGAIRISAGTTLWDIESSSEVQRLVPGLAQAVGQIGNIRVRMKATVGGNIMVGDPSMDVLPLMMALDAILTFATDVNEQAKIPADKLFPLGSSAPVVAGLLLEAVIPTGGNIRLGYDRTLRPAITLAVGLEIERDHAIAVRASLACAHPRACFDKVELSPPLALDDLAASVPSLAAAWAEALPEPLSDGIASGRYRRRTAAVLMRRQLEQLGRDLKRIAP